MSRDPDPIPTKETAVAAWVQTRVVLRIITILLVVAAVLWVLYKLTAILLLLVLSVFFAYLVAPLVDLVEQPLKLGAKTIRIPRGLAIGIVYVVLFVGGGVAVYFLAPQLASQFPEFKQQAIAYYKTLSGTSDRVNEYFRGHRMPQGLVKAINDTFLGLIARGGEVAGVAAEKMLGLIIFLPLVNPDSDPWFLSVKGCR
jgi:predicted PurR-regulated permease PerM